jgi:murein DD-endopeptidase MepM/ murein hydrolase activator NlpD
VNRKLPLVLFFTCFIGTLLFSQPVTIAVIPENPLPGEPISVAIAGTNGVNLQAVLVNRQGRIAGALFFSLEEAVNGSLVRAALLTVPTTAASGVAVIRIENGGEIIKEVDILIGERKFVSETIPLDENNTELRTVSTPEKIAESNRLWAILSHTGTNVYTGLPFAPPVAAKRRTSFFGDRRIFKYSDGTSESAIHAGIDYGVPTGTPVTACAEGKVVFAGFRIVTGNSVIIEHLPGVYSLYYHMSKLTVKADMMVHTGTLLGESGATGLATGPHLHWEIRIATENTDPDICTSRPILDKAALLKKLGQF